MSRSIVETVLGALVLFVAGIFLTFSYKTADVGTVGGLNLSADFSAIGGLKSGDEVVISGVKVGNVTSVELLKDTYLARVHMEVDPSVKLPVDSGAVISSESLLGGRFLALEPGGDSEILENGGQIQYTQAPQNLEQLLGQFIFSMKKDDGNAAAEQPPEQPKEKVAETPVQIQTPDSDPADSGFLGPQFQNP